MPSQIAACLCSLLFALVVALGSAQHEESGSYPTMRGDLKYIRCNVCNEAAGALQSQVAALPKQKKSKSSKGPGNPSEEAVAHIIEGICSAQDSSGKWILNMDVVESGDGLALAKHSVQGQCRSECRTIATSCFEVFEKVDMDDLQVALWKGITKEALTKKVCNEWTSVCKKKKLSPVKDREDEEFVDEDGNVLYSTSFGGGSGSSSASVMASITDAMDKMLGFIHADASQFVKGYANHAYSQVVYYHKQAAKVVTYKSAAKEFDKLQGFYKGLYKSSTKDKAEKQYAKTKKEAKRVYNLVHKTATTAHKTKADKSGMLLAAFVLVVMFLADCILRMLSKAFEAIVCNKQAVNDAAGMFIFLCSNLVVGAMLVYVTTK